MQLLGAEALTDKRRTKRMRWIAAAMATTPRRRLPQRFAAQGEVKAAYPLLRQPEATPDALQARHRCGHSHWKLSGLMQEGDRQRGIDIVLSLFTTEGREGRAQKQRVTRDAVLPWIFPYKEETPAFQSGDTLRLAA